MPEPSPTAATIDADEPVRPGHIRATCGHTPVLHDSIDQRVHENIHEGQCCMAAPFSYCCAPYPDS